LGQEEVDGGPQNFTPNQFAVKGGVVRRFTQSEGMGQVHHSEPCINSGGASKQLGGVYSDGPRKVYNQLTNGPPIISPTIHRVSQASKHQNTTRTHPIPATIRRQQKLIKKYNLCPSAPVSSSQSISHTVTPGNEGQSRRDEGVVRNPPSQSTRKKQQEGSLSSAGEILCCSSINSSDIRNCNARNIDNLNNDAAQKVWRGVLDLGVVGEEGDEVYVQRILTNENKEEELRIQREQLSKGLP
jgi:hypothetical protein